MLHLGKIIISDCPSLNVEFIKNIWHSLLTIIYDSANASA